MNDRPTLITPQTISLYVESNGPDRHSRRRRRGRGRRNKKKSLLDLEAALSSSFVTASEGERPTPRPNKSVEADRHCRCRMRRAAPTASLDELEAEEGRLFQRDAWRQELRLGENSKQYAM